MDRKTIMNDEGRRSAFDAVISLLAHNRQQAASPSYQTIEDLSDALQKRQETVQGVRVCRVPHSTAHGVFSRSWKRIPRWELVESLWATLYAHAELKGRPTGAMFSLAQVCDRYREVEMAAPRVLGQSRQPQPVAAAPVSAEHRQGADLLVSPMDWDSCLSSTQGTAQSAGNGGDRRGIREVDAQFVAELMERSSNAPWRPYRDVIPDWFLLYVMAEPQLAEIRTYAPLRIPSLLQTSEYARLAITRDLPGIGERDLQRRIELRLCRQDILYHPGSPKLWMIIHERALWEVAGSRPVLRAQIRHLLSLAAHSNITLQILPADEANEAFADGPVTVMRFPERHIDDMIYLEQREHALYLHRNRDVTYFSKLFSSLLVAALPTGDSLHFLNELL
ncbi:DUF5753 domain-containing protein [Actinomadura violacea]|uniref:DUF5753 domain-containing protein n=1 Tax=Actinomadura violacea TaxID=2819934 RepID=A0ABS3RSV7_9ACTN|nr:DUF5753 domain-containing protein [Actinomadura violacea]MBO2459851.1 hypothetical protein [Actinomadura violacea]